MYAHMSAEIPWATDARAEVPPACREIAKRAMAKKPDDRFQTASEMARALTAARPPSRARRAAQRPRPADDARRAAGRGAPRRAACRRPPRRAADAARPPLAAAAAATATVGERRKLPVGLHRGCGRRGRLIAVVARRGARFRRRRRAPSSELELDPRAASDARPCSRTRPTRVAISVPGQARTAWPRAAATIWVTGPSDGRRQPDRRRVRRQGRQADPGRRRPGHDRAGRRGRVGHEQGLRHRHPHRRAVGRGAGRDPGRAPRRRGSRSTRTARRGWC